jgi:hypothetical protein
MIIRIVRESSMINARMGVVGLVLKELGLGR